MARVLEGATESPRRISVNFITRKFQAIAQFYRDIKLEMKRVTWPTREEVYQTTAVTILVVCFFGYFLWGTNILLAYLVRHLIEFLSK